ESASPTLDANVIDGASCSHGTSSSSTTLRLSDSASMVTNNLLRGGSCDGASEVVRFEKGSGPEALSPTIENNTLEYGGGTHTGLFVDSTGSVPPAGYVRNTSSTTRPPAARASQSTSPTRRATSTRPRTTTSTTRPG